jgi:hypothetical protein
MTGFIFWTFSPLWQAPPARQQISFFIYEYQQYRAPGTAGIFTEFFPGKRFPPSF